MPKMKSKRIRERLVRQKRRNGELRRKEKREQETSKSKLQNYRSCSCLVQRCQRFGIKNNASAFLGHIMFIGFRGKTVFSEPISLLSAKILREKNAHLYRQALKE